MGQGNTSISEDNPLDNPSSDVKKMGKMLTNTYSYFERTATLGIKTNFNTHRNWIIERIMIFGSDKGKVYFSPAYILIGLFLILFIVWFIKGWNDWKEIEKKRFDGK